MATPNSPNASPASNSCPEDSKDTLTTRLETKPSHTLTVLWSDLPAWLQDNQHIHSGYRPASNSYRKSFASLTHLHNESVNIYTHLVGAVLAFLAAVYAYEALRPRYEQATRQDITTIGAATMVVALFPRFRTPAWRPFRAFMFVAMGLSALFPVIHGVKTFGVAQLERQIGLSWLVTQGLLYILGAGIYAARIPEKLAPGSFDIWGSSHQIFHVLVVMAAGAHLIGLLKAFDYAHSSRSLAG
ncbi:hypothetical protein MBLNU13_g07898t2 [Cladosporium sp. NU13]